MRVSNYISRLRPTIYQTGKWKMVPFIDSLSDNLNDSRKKLSRFFPSVFTLRHSGGFVWHMPGFRKKNKVRWKTNRRNLHKRCKVGPRPQGHAKGRQNSAMTSPESETRMRSFLLNSIVYVHLYFGSEKKKSECSCCGRQQFSQSSAQRMLTLSQENAILRNNSGGQNKNRTASCVRCLYCFVWQVESKATDCHEKRLWAVAEDQLMNFGSGRRNGKMCVEHDQW